jgi:hypothetical protein
MEEFEKVECPNSSRRTEWAFALGRLVTRERFGAGAQKTTHHAKQDGLAQ